MLGIIERLACRLALGSAWPNCTLLAISNLLSAAIVLILRSAV
ncbi:hypothetical protein ACVWZ4_006223 [Bradyrhizobium sp. USDA 4472]